MIIVRSHMKKIMIILAVITCIGLPTKVVAQERGAIYPLMAVSKEAKVKLKADRKIAIFLNGNDPLLKRIAEDSLSIHLNNAGFVSINREVLEKSVGDQVAKKRKEKAEETLNALDIGKVVNADSILTGTVIMESGEQQSLLVKIASFQMVDIATGETLISALFEPEKGKSFSEVTKSFVEILKQNMR